MATTTNTPPAAVPARKAADWQPSPRTGGRDLGISAVVALVIMSPILAAGGARMYTTWSTREAERLAKVEAAQAHERLVAAPAQPVLDAKSAAHGRDLFATSCMACHGPKGEGVQGLGKSLTDSDFVAGRDDEAMLAFLVTGRPTAKPLPMPARGGRDDFSDADLRDVITFVRGLQDPRRMPELPAPVVTAAPSDADKAKALAAAGGDAELAEYIASGTKIYGSLCIACHGAGGVGMPGNGKPLVKNSFVQSLDDDALLAFIKQGRSPTDPKNTTGIQMPPKGGNPAMSDDDILDVIAYIRTLQGNQPTSDSTKN